MENQIKVYLDIETTATKVGAAIWDIGIVVDKGDGKVIEFETFINPYSLGYASAIYDRDTIAWINSKPEVFNRFEEAQVSQINSVDAMRSIANFLLESTDELIAQRNKAKIYSWGNFDMPILKHWLDTYKRYGWHYGNEVDFRSIMRHFNLPLRPDTNRHEALADAQALRATVRQFEKTFSLDMI